MMNSGFHGCILYHILLVAICSAESSIPYNPLQQSSPALKVDPLAVPTQPVAASTAQAPGIPSQSGQPGTVFARGAATPTKGPARRFFPAFKVSSDGSPGRVEITRHGVAHELGFPLRDLRLIDPTFSEQVSVLARKNAVLFAVKHVKALIKWDEMLVFDTEHPDTQSIIPAVQQQLSTLAQTAQHSPEGGGESLPRPPFEEVALEACLHQVIALVQGRLEKLRPLLRQVLAGLKKADLTLQSRLDQLLPLKNQLTELQATLSELCRCLNDVLLNDADMAQMYLTEAAAGIQRDVHEHEEIEMMFENYLTQAELLASDVREYQNEIKNTEEVVEIQLDLLRNRILKFELTLSISAFMVASGGLVTGIFGMNLLSNLETHPKMFWIVVGMIYAGILAGLGGTVAVCHRQKLL